MPALAWVVRLSGGDEKRTGHILKRFRCCQKRIGISSLCFREAFSMKRNGESDVGLEGVQNLCRCSLFPQAWQEMAGKG